MRNIEGKEKLHRCDKIDLSDWKRVSSRAAVVSLIIVIFLLLTGGSLNPAFWAQQAERRIDPSSLLEIDDEALLELEKEFIFFNRNIEDGMVYPCFPEDDTVFHDIYCFIYKTIAYRRDQSLYYSLDHLAKPSEVITKGADDCDGKAVLIGTLLIKRGYDAYVVMGTEHTWVEVLNDGYTVYISRLDCDVPVLITDEPLPEIRSTYVKFNMSENQWMPLGLVIQGSVVFFYTFFVLLVLQLVYINRLHERPARYFSEIFGYFRFILYMFISIFVVWVLILLLIKYLSTIQ